MENYNTLKNLVNTGAVKFTPAQAKIVRRLLNGDKLTTINAHRMNGGEYRWVAKGSKNHDYAGKVYRAFWNIPYAVKKQTGVILDMDEFHININTLKNG